MSKNSNDVGFISFLSSAVSGLVGGVSDLYFDRVGGVQQAAHEKEKLSKIISGIDAQASYRTALLGMEKEPAIHQFLVGFFAGKKIVPWEVYDNKKNAYMALQLGVKLLSTALLCHPKGKEKADFFNAYREALKYYHAREKSQEALQQLSMTAQHIVEVLKPEEDSLYKRYQCVAAKEIFLKCYEAALKRTNTYDAGNEASQFFEKRLEEIGGPGYSVKISTHDQSELLEYYAAQLNKDTASKKAAQAFEKACLEMFNYEPEALRNLKYQALCQAVDEGSIILKGLTDQYQDIDINARIKVTQEEPVNGDESERDEDVETLLTRAIRKRKKQSVIEVLIEKGAEVNRLENETRQRTPLHVAVEEGMYFIIPLLVSKKANPTLYDFKGHTPLSDLVDTIQGYFNRNVHNVADEESNIDFLNSLYEPMKLLICQKTVNQYDKILKYKLKTSQDTLSIEGATPTFKFIVYLFRLLKIEMPSEDTQTLESDHVKPPITAWLDRFVDSGADLSATDSRGNTLLHYLADFKQGYGALVMTETQAMQWLMLLNSLEISDDKKKLPLNEKNKAGETPMDIAKARNWPIFKDTVQEVIDRGTACSNRLGL